MIRIATPKLKGLLVRALGDPAGLAPRHVVPYGFLLGFFGGLVEAAYLSIRQLVKHQPAAWYYPELLWMAPLAAGVTMALMGAVLGLLARAAHTKVAVGMSTFLLAVPGIYGVAQSRGIPLHPAAEVVLSLGIAAMFARLAARDATGVVGLVRRTVLPLSVLTLVLVAYGVYQLPRFVERRALAALGPARAAAPNVLLIILDTVRAPNLGMHGYERPTSPALDGWAGSGVVFERAIATAPWTLPSHASMFTGHYNFSVGSSFTQPMDARLPTLAERLAAAGYATAGFVANLSYTSRASGLHRGFARYEDFPVGPAMFLRSAWLPRRLSGALARATGIGAWPVPKRAEHLSDEFEAWLTDRPDRPFFVFLNYFDAHDPYDPPPPYRGRFGPAPDEELSDDRPYSTEELKPWIDAYDASIRYVDDQLARVFELLEREAIREKTLVVVTSDHGEMFGERGQVQHTSGLYMPVLHVPLIFVLPGTIPSGRRVAAPVTLRDLPRTILDLVGLAEDTVIPGAPLTRHWREGLVADSPSPVLSELDFQGGVAAWKPINHGHMKSLVDGGLHYIHNGNGVEELYDAVQDPAASEDLASKPESQSALEGFRRTLGRIYTDPEAGAGVMSRKGGTRLANGRRRTPAGVPPGARR